MATLGVNDLRPPLGLAPGALLWPCSAGGSCHSEVRPDLQNGLAVWGCDGGRGSMCHARRMTDLSQRGGMTEAEEVAGARAGGGAGRFEESSVL